jgi:hypothetical protein
MIAFRMKVMAVVAVLIALILALSAAPASATPGRVDLVLDQNDASPFMSEVIAGLQTVVNEHPEVVNIVLTSEPLDYEGNVFAGTLKGTNVVIVNEVYANDGVYADQRIGESIASGFHPEGCTPGRTLGLHEGAHVIDNAHGQRAWNIVSAKYGAGHDLWDDLPGYSFDILGDLEPGEALATAYASVKCGSANAVEHDLYNILVNS